METPVKVVALPSGKKLMIFRDLDAINPRLLEGTRCRMIFLHKRHELGDPHIYKKPEDVESLVDGMDEIVLMPVFMLEEGGHILLDFEPFIDQEIGCGNVDTGQLGLMYITRLDIEEALGIWAEASRIQAVSILEHELRDYNEWLNSDTYRYKIVDADGAVLSENCGFCGADHELSGLYEDAGVEMFDGVAIDEEVK
jgi:hypothetical protein